MPLTPHEQLALDYAHLYRSRGFNPIPSSLDEKKPLYSFKREYGWDRPFPGDWFTQEAWERHPTTNLQLCCGVAWRLIVIDLDGDEAHEVFRNWGPVGRTWVTARDGGASRHYWFRLRETDTGPYPKRLLWKGDGKHQAIERLCDASLIVVPPSFHVTHKDCQYRFLEKCGPKHVPLPALCPAWLLKRKPIEPERPAWVPMRAGPRPATSPASFVPTRELLDAVQDKVGLARSLGVRFTGRVSADGWAECHAIDRPDNDPSAAVHTESGWYTDRGSSVSFSFLDLYAMLTGLRSWREAKDELAERFR